MRAGAVRKLLGPVFGHGARVTKPVGEGASVVAGPSRRSFPGFVAGESPDNTPRSPGLLGEGVSGGIGFQPHETEAPYPRCTFAKQEVHPYGQTAVLTASPHGGWGGYETGARSTSPSGSAYTTSRCLAEPFGVQVVRMSTSWPRASPIWRCWFERIRLPDTT
jgi:hypothetical protein